MTSSCILVLFCSEYCICLVSYSVGIWIRQISNPSHPQGTSRAYGGYSIGGLHIETTTEANFYKRLEITHRTHARVCHLKDDLLLEFLRLVKLLSVASILFTISSLAYAFGILLRNVQIPNASSTLYHGADEPAK